MVYHLTCEWEPDGQSVVKDVEMRISEMNCINSTGGRFVGLLKVKNNSTTCGEVVSGKGPKNKVQIPKLYRTPFEIWILVLGA